MQELSVALSSAWLGVDVERQEKDKLSQCEFFILSTTFSHIEKTPPSAQTREPAGSILCIG